MIERAVGGLAVEEGTGNAVRRSARARLSAEPVERSLCRRGDELNRARHAAGNMISKRLRDFEQRACAHCKTVLVTKLPFEVGPVGIRTSLAGKREGIEARRDIRRAG